MTTQAVGSLAAVPLQSDTAIATLRSLDGAGFPPNGVAVGGVAIPAEIGESLVPRAGRTQVVGMRWTVGGIVVPASRFTGPREVRHRTDGTASWSCQVPVSSEFGDVWRWPLGNPLAIGAPAPGGQDVDVDGLYVTSAGVIVAYPLLRGGRATSNRVVLDADGRRMLQVEGQGASVLWRERTVDLDLPAGHNLLRSEVRRRLAAAAGAPTPTSAPSRRMRKAVSLSAARWWPVAQELAELDGVVLTEDEGGGLREVPVVDDFSRPTEVTLGTRDVLIGGASANFGQAELTKITLTTEEQLPADDCGLVPIERTTEIFEPKSTIRQAHWQINADGTLTALNPPTLSTTELVLTRRVTIRRTEFCGEEVARRTIVEALKSRRTWRREIDSTGAIIAHNSGAFVYEAGADSGGAGTEEAFQQRKERLMVVSDEFHRKVFDDVTRAKTQEVTELQAWVFPETHLKEKVNATFTGWEDEPFVARKLRGNGAGVGGEVGSRETEFFTSTAATNQFGPLAGPAGASVAFARRETLDIETDEAGEFTVRERRTREDLRLLETGDRYFFLGARTSQNPTARSGVVETIDQSYLPQGDTSVEVRVKRDETVIDGEEVEVVERDGFLPEVEKLPQLEPDSTLFDNDEDRDAAESAAPAQRALRSAQCEIPSLADHHPEREAEQSVTYAEDDADLESLCLQRLLDGIPTDVEVTVPALFGVRKGQVVRVRVPSLDLNHRVLIREHAHRDDGAASPILTTVRGRVRVAA